LLCHGWWEWRCMFCDFCCWLLNCSVILHVHSVIIWRWEVAALQSVTGILSNGVFLKHFKSRGGLAYTTLACQYNRHIVCKF
jgi:hypothetical protein